MEEEEDTDGSTDLEVDDEEGEEEEEVTKNVLHMMHFRHKPGSLEEA